VNGIASQIIRNDPFEINHRSLERRPLDRQRAPNTEKVHP